MRKEKMILRMMMNWILLSAGVFENTLCTADRMGSEEICCSY